MHFAGDNGFNSLYQTLTIIAHKLQTCQTASAADNLRRFFPMKIHIRTTRCQKTELPAAVGLADGIWSRSGQAVLRGTAMAVFCMAVAVCSQAAAQEGD